MSLPGFFSSVLRRMFSRGAQSPAENPKPPPFSLLRNRKMQYGTEDFYPGTYASGLTPANYGAAVREADGGQIATLIDMLQDIERRDGHLRGVMGSRFNAVAGKGWGLIPHPNDTDDTVASWVKEIFDDLSVAKPMLPGQLHQTFSGSLQDLSTGVYTGLSAQEIMWDVSSGQAMIDELRWVHPRRFMINTSSDTRPLGELLLRTAADDLEGEQLWPAKWVLHRPRWQGDWAWKQVLGTIVGWLWVFKAFALRDWSYLSELTGVPMRVAKYAEGTPPDLIAELKAELATVGTDFYAVIPYGTDLQFVEATHGGQYEFHRVFVDWCDKQISKAVVGHSAAADATSGRLGGEDLAETVRRDIIENDAAQLQSTIDRDLIAPMVGINFGWDAPRPMFKLYVDPPVDLEKQSQIDERLTKMGVDFDRRYFTETYRIPERRKDSEMVVPLVLQQAVIQSPVDKPGTSEDDGLKDKDLDPLEARAGKIAKRFREHSSQADKLVDNSVRLSEPIWKAWLKPLTDVVEHAESFAELDFYYIEDLLGTALIDTYLAEVQYSAHALGWAQIADECGTLKAPIEASTRHVRAAAEDDDGGDDGLDAETIFAPLPNPEAVAWLQHRVGVPYAEWVVASDAIRARSFALAKVESAFVADEVRDAIARALEKGSNYRTFVRDYADTMDRIGVSATNPYHLETVFRNAVHNALNVARYDQMSKPEVVRARPFWQYRAIIDGRTTPLCASLDGEVYPADSPFWDTWTPPNHHRCRSAAVTLDEEEVKDMGLTLQEEIPPPGVGPPDKGWAVNPALKPDEV